MAGEESSPWEAGKELLEQNRERLDRLEKAQHRLEIRVDEIQNQQHAQDIITTSIREVSDRILARLRSAQSERKRDARSMQIAILDVSRRVRFQSAMISAGFGVVIVLLSVKAFWE